MPDREEVLQSLVLQMSMYPEDTVFFLDVWCFGWEYVVEEVARHFGSQVSENRSWQVVLHCRPNGAP